MLSAIPSSLSLFHVIHYLSLTCVLLPNKTKPISQKLSVSSVHTSESHCYTCQNVIHHSVILVTSLLCLYESIKHGDTSFSIYPTVQNMEVTCVICA